MAQEFTQWIETIVEFAHFLLAGAAIYYLWLTIFGTEKKESGGSWGKNVGKIKENTPFIGKNARKNKKLKRAAKREKTKLLSEYIEEKKESRLIDDAIKAMKKFEGTVDIGLSKGLNKKDPFLDEFNKVKNSVSDADKEIKKLKKATWRADRKTDVLIKELDKAGTKDEELNELKALENDILKHHDDLNKEMDAISEDLEDNGTVGKDIVPIKNRRKKPPMALSDEFNDKKTLTERLTNIKTNLGSTLTKLEDMEKIQNKAYDETKGLIAKVHKLWKYFETK